MAGRLYLDEDSMIRALARALRSRGVDVETALEAKMIERPDDEHLAYAASSRRVLFTCNVGHFCALHKAYLEQGKTHAGIIVEPHQGRSVGAQLRGILTLFGELSPEQMENRLEFLSYWS